MRCCYTLVLLAAAAASTASAANLSDFADYSLRNPHDQVELPGRLYTPPAAAVSPRPLMVFLHGGGAIGTNNTTQVEHTPDPLLDEAKRRGAYLYLPQAPGGWGSLASIDAAMTMIGRAVTQLNADARRLYVTGYSNGGGGTWNILSRNPDTFAAAIAVAGVTPAAGFRAANLLDTAIIAVHSADDPTVHVGRSRTIVNGILAAGGQPLPKYPPPGSLQNMLVANPTVPFHQQVIASQPLGSTINHYISRPDLDLLYFEQPFGGHSAPLGVFWSPPVYDWMFSHAVGVPEPRAASLFATIAIICAAFRPTRRSPTGLAATR